LTVKASVVSDKSAENEMMVSEAPVEEVGRHPEDAETKVYPVAQDEQAVAAPPYENVVLETAAHGVHIDVAVFQN